MTLESICSLIADCPHSTPFWTASGYLVIRNQNIKNGQLDLSEKSYTDHKHYLIRIRRARPQYGDLIFTREAPMGEVCMVPEDLECCVGQRQVLLRPDPEKVHPRYLLYAIQSPEVQHEISWSEGTGSTVSNVRIPVLKSLKIPVRSITEQVQAASLLGALDDRIALLHETNATLESIAQALFKSWFVDFDPVRARQQGLAPEG
ncbi:MAG: restriction endonuclease subunit S, partial [Zoogloea sp.]|nr:restriction endonuclease subunit S [Zoogloea sp.]